MTQPVFSPDGKWMWTGNEWIPAPPQSQTLSPKISDSVVIGDVVTHNQINSDTLSKSETAYSEAKKCFESEEFNDAFRLFCLSLEGRGDHELSAIVNTQLWIGKCYRALGDRKQSLDYLMSLDDEKISLLSTKQQIELFQILGDLKHLPAETYTSEMPFYEKALKLCDQSSTKGLEILEKMVLASRVHEDWIQAAHNLIRKSNAMELYHSKEDIIFQLASFINSLGFPKPITKLRLESANLVVKYMDDFCIKRFCSSEDISSFLAPLALDFVTENTKYNLFSGTMDIGSLKIIHMDIFGQIQSLK